MAYNDWDQDDLLNFQYDRPIPQEITEQAKREEKLRRDAQEAAYLRYRQEYADKSKRESSRLERQNAKEAKLEAKARAKADSIAKKQQKLEKKEAKRAKRAAKKSGNVYATASEATKEISKFYKFTKILSIPYVVLFAAFTIIMTIMNVLPFFLMVALYITLGLLSVIIVIQLTKDNIKKWAKVFSTVMAIVLILFYGVGSAYALGTLSFLDSTSVKNEKSVGKITKEPFNVLITGMDVWGKIDVQGRSDVNMLVTVNPKTETILMTSTPRDYQVRLPDKGYATDKLTHSGFYGVDTTIQAIEDLFQVKANYYVKVNFSTIVKFIDAIGGLDFYNEQAFTSAITGHYYAEGKIHVQGRGALYYARERKAFNGGDNQRVVNQQKIFSEMLKKATKSSTMLLSYSKILSSLDDYFQMSFSSREIRSLVRFQLAKRIEWKMFKNSLAGPGSTQGTYSTGSTKVYVMAQDPTSVANAQALIQAVHDGKKLRTNDDGVVEIVTEEETAE